MDRVNSGRYEGTNLEVPEKCPRESTAELESVMGWPPKVAVTIELEVKPAPKTFTIVPAKLTFGDVEIEGCVAFPNAYR
jgi:hypothetical protein